MNDKLFGIDVSKRAFEMESVDEKVTYKQKRRDGKQSGFSEYESDLIHNEQSVNTYYVDIMYHRDYIGQALDEMQSDVKIGMVIDKKPVAHEIEPNLWPESISHHSSIADAIEYVKDKYGQDYKNLVRSGKLQCSDSLSDQDKIIFDKCVNVSIAEKNASNDRHTNVESIVNDLHHDVDSPGY